MRWKDNWEEVRVHHERWWRRDGLVVVPYVPPEVLRAQPSRDPAAVHPGAPRDAEVLAPPAGPPAAAQGAP